MKSIASSCKGLSTNQLSRVQLVQPILQRNHRTAHGTCKIHSISLPALSLPSQKKGSFESSCGDCTLLIFHDSATNSRLLTAVPVYTLPLYLHKTSNTNCSMACKVDNRQSWRLDAIHARKIASPSFCKMVRLQCDSHILSPPFMLLQPPQNFKIVHQHPLWTMKIISPWPFHGGS